MAKVTITMTDNEAGGVNVDVTYDPPMKPDSETQEASEAQTLAYMLMSYAAFLAREGFSPDAEST